MTDPTAAATTADNGDPAATDTEAAADEEDSLLREQLRRHQRETDRALSRILDAVEGQAARWDERWDRVCAALSKLEGDRVALGLGLGVAAGTGPKRGDGDGGGPEGGGAGVDGRASSGKAEAKAHVHTKAKVKAKAKAKGEAKAKAKAKGKAKAAKEKKRGVAPHGAARGGAIGTAIAKAAGSLALALAILFLFHGRASVGRGEDGPAEPPKPTHRRTALRLASGRVDAGVEEGATRPLSLRQEPGADGGTPSPTATRRPVAVPVQAVDPSLGLGGATLFDDGEPPAQYYPVWTGNLCDDDPAGLSGLDDGVETFASAEECCQEWFPERKEDCVLDSTSRRTSAVPSPGGTLLGPSALSALPTSRSSGHLPSEPPSPTDNVPTFRPTEDISPDGTVPSLSPTPSTSIATSVVTDPVSQLCHWIDINLTYEYYSTISWTLDRIDAAGIVEVKSHQKDYGETSHVESLCLEEGEYEFTVGDPNSYSSYYLPGAFALTFGGAVLADGGYGDYSETTRFTIPLPPTQLPSALPSVYPSSSISPSVTTEPSSLPTDSGVPTITQVPTITVGTCGNGFRGDGICSSGRCCSGSGYCGTSNDYCWAQQCEGSDQQACGCRSSSQLDYRGSISKTKSGYECESWNAAWIGEEWGFDYVRKSASFNLDGNSCRNPDLDQRGTWCFTKDNRGYDYCEVPICEDEMSSSPSSAVSNEPSSATSTSSLSIDVGDVGTPGRAAEYFDGRWVVKGSGKSFYWTSETTDNFHFVAFRKSGNVIAEIRLDRYEYNHANQKGGLMIRESFETGSKHYSLFLNGMQYLESYSRSETDGGTRIMKDQSNPTLPLWLRIEKIDNLFTSQFKYGDIPDWTSSSSWEPVTIEFDTELFWVGIAVNSWDRDELATLEASNFRITDESLPSAFPSSSVPPTMSLSPSRPPACEGSDYRTCGCSNVNQADFRGVLATTKSGFKCDGWGHFLGLYPDAGLEDGNFCRNPTANIDATAWCFTSEPGAGGFEECDVPICDTKSSVVYTKLQPFSVKVMVYTNVDGAPAGEYFSFRPSDFEAVLGSIENGRIFRAIHWRQNKVIWSGSIEVFLPEANDWAHTSHGRREIPLRAQGNSQETAAFQDGDWLTPSVVEIKVYRHPNPVYRPHGTFFTFNQALFESVLGRPLSENGTEVKVDQWRDGGIISTITITVWATTYDFSLGQEMPPIGRREPSLGGYHFQDEDLLEPKDLPFGQDAPPLQSAGLLSEQCEGRDSACCGSLEANQKDYRGNISTTESGHRCARWDWSGLPNNYAEEYAGLEGNNFCRNPGGARDRAWCFTAVDPDDAGGNHSNWEFCDVPKCIPTSTNHVARAIRINLIEEGFLTLAEVRVLDQDGVNRAFHKPTTQSSDHTKHLYKSRGEASNAVDGELGDFSQTNFELGAWWQVDLEADIEVKEIIVYNRIDCCKERLSNSVVSLLDDTGATIKRYFIDDASSKQRINLKEPSCEGSRPDVCGCANIQQVDYLGTMNTTKSGFGCSMWDDDMIQSHPNAGLEDGNFCRNPGGIRDRAWCYTADAGSIGGWEFCDIPSCFSSSSSCTYFEYSNDPMPDDTKAACAYYECASDHEYALLDILHAHTMNDCQCLHEIWDCEFGSKNCQTDPAKKWVYECCSSDFTTERANSCECMLKPPCDAGDSQKCGEYAEYCCENDYECKCQYQTKACVLAQENVAENDSAQYCHKAADACCWDENENESNVDIGACRCDFWDDRCQSFPNLCGQASVSCCGNDVCLCHFLDHAGETLGWVDENYETESYCDSARAIMPDSNVEKSSLQTIYEETAGIHWFNNTGWMTVAHHCDGWYGVTCDDDGFISQIVLRKNNVTGMLPSNSLSKMYRIQTLDLAENNLRGPLAGTVQNLRGDLIFDASVFYQLQELTQVDLSQNMLSGELDVLLSPSLVHANFSQNEFTSAKNFMEFKYSWEILRTFDLSHNLIEQESTKFLSNIPPNIEQCVLSHNLMYGSLPKSLDNLEYLEEFVAGSNMLSGTLPEFMSSPDLKVLDLSDQKYGARPSPPFTGTIPVRYAKFPFLSSLDLSGNKLSGSIPLVLGNMAQLKYFDLSDNDLNQLIPTQLGKLAGVLEYIDLSKNMLSGRIPSELGLFKDAIAVLLIENKDLESPAPLSLCHVDSYAQKNDVSFCPPERNALKDIYESAKGREWTNSSNWVSQYGSHCFWHGIRCDASNSTTNLTLRNNGLSGQLNGLIGHLSSLEVLDLSDNSIKGTIPAEIGRLSRLKIFRLAYNEFIDTVPTELGLLNHLELVQLQSNRLTGTMPALNATFDGDYSYITDCGVPSAFETPFWCEDCTMCCNMEENCYPTTETDVQKLSEVFPRGFTTYMSFTWVFFLCVCAFCCVVALISFVYDRCKSKSRRELGAQRQLSWLFRRDSAFAIKNIGEDSVYQFFLTTNRAGWVYALAVLGSQLWALFIFVIGAEFELSDDNSDLVYTFSCPRDQNSCYDRADLTWQGWAVFMVLMAAHLLEDMMKGLRLVIFSGKARHETGSRTRSFIGGLVLFFVAAFTAYASTLYNTAIATSNTEIIANSVIILFITTLDELFYSIFVTAKKLLEDGISGMIEEEPTPDHPRDKDDQEEIELLREQNASLNSNTEALQEQNNALWEQNRALKQQNKLVSEQNEALKKLPPMHPLSVAQDETVDGAGMTSLEQHGISANDTPSTGSLTQID